MKCPHCHEEVPRSDFCIRCGEPLENAASPYPHEGRGFAAAPHERWSSPRVVSSLFPHLPRTHLVVFRIALAIGALALVALALARLFPVALVVAAIVVPLLTVLYFVHVDVYEQEPWPAFALTLVWGGLAGLGIGLASRSIVRSDTAILAGDRSHIVWSVGVALPLLGAALTVLGPLVLLPYRSFNDVLDGTTFGASCAVAFIGAEILASSADFLHAGASSVGSRTPWTLRLLTLGITVPVLGAAAFGAALGTIWLRYRAPVRDRTRLGLAGLPVVAVPTAAGALVGTALAELYLGRLVALVVLASAAAVALLWLRRVIHLGLVEELAEREVGAQFTCPNCGRETPRHTFCANCGVSLQALPKAPPTTEVSE